jgi:3-phenylpropionate/cinnamic acid dioxygenase small subunit
MAQAHSIAAMTSAPLSRADCEDFLINEARLLDDGLFDDWLALFTLEAHYWVPSEPDQQSPLDTLSLMYDDRRLLETRVRRLASPRIYSQEPRSRTSRIVTNVTVENASAQTTFESQGDGALVRSKFTMVEFRREEQRLFAGTYFHRLVQGEAGIRIAFKRINLINCDAPLDGLVVPF